MLLKLVPAQFTTVDIYVLTSSTVLEKQTQKCPSTVAELKSALHFICQNPKRVETLSFIKQIYG